VWWLLVVDKMCGEVRSFTAVGFRIPTQVLFATALHRMGARLKPLSAQLAKNSFLQTAI
jgi:hypothetical protein